MRAQHSIGVDLVVLNEESTCALDFNHAQEALAGRYSALSEHHVEKPGRIFVLGAGVSRQAHSTAGPTASAT